MTFSDKGVQKALTDRFVLGWENTKDDASAGASFAHSPKDPSPSCVKGNGEHNIQILLCTADGRLLDVIAGYVAPADLRKELDWATALGDSLVKAQDREAAVTTAHEAAVRRIDEAADDGKDPFAKFGRTLDRSAHAYVAAHPLQPAAEFEPTGVVGNGSSFFGSSRGEKPTEKIGKMPEMPKDFGEGSGR